MSKTYFISDLHLGEDFPEITACFEQFMREVAPTADALYVLGDLFEVWIGDDNVTAFNEHIAQLFKRASQEIPIYFIHGNRDFAIGKAFANKAGFTILDEQTVIDLYGTPTLLLHGDELCTKDVEYQKFRKRARTWWWKGFMGALPLKIRKRIAAEGREKSKNNKQRLASSIMDVTPEEVVAVFEKHGVQNMIHGHTHRPDTHHLTANQKPATRIVLGDWYEQGSVLEVTADKKELKRLKFQ
jgi:UDP-2,3-diacylglucosamine hydrolase